MKLADLQYVPQFDLLAPHALFRIQATRTRRGTVKVGRVLLAPSHQMIGRFDIHGVPVGYFAESPETAAYEALCRRESMGLSVSVLAKRSLLCLQTTAPLKLLDLRPHAQSWPVLQSLRFEHTQAVAAETFAQGFSGIAYRSAQQYGMDCYAIFGDALKILKPAWTEPLLEPGTGNFHRTVASALEGSRITLVP